MSVEGQFAAPREYLNTPRYARRLGGSYRDHDTSEVRRRIPLSVPLPSKKINGSRLLACDAVGRLNLLGDHRK